MARKWDSLFSILRSLKVKISQMGHWLLQRKKGWLAIALALLTLCLVVGTSPVLSQTSSESSTCPTQMPYEQGDSAETASSLSLAAAARSLETMVGCWERQAREAGQRPEANSYWRNWAIASVNLGRLYAELGQQARACETLTQALGLSIKRRQSDGLWIEVQEPNICENEDLPKPESEDEDSSPQSMWEIIGPLKTQNLVQANSLRILGDVLRTIGQLDNSHAVLQRSRQIIDAQGDSNDDITKAKASVYLSLGNTYRAKGNLERDRQAPPNYDYLPWRYSSKCIPNEEDCVPEDARTEYDKAEKTYRQEEIATKALLELPIKAQLNLLSLFIDLKDWPRARDTFNQSVFTSESWISQVPDARTRIYTRINLAKNLAFLLQNDQIQNDQNQDFSWERVKKQLTDAGDEAHQLGDRHAESYAAGNLAGLYEYCSLPGSACGLGQVFQQARQLTEEALYLAQPSEAPDIAYQWQWQMGRLLNARGEREEAIASYERAVQTLESLRGDLRTIRADIQFSFRDNVEPVYRELVDSLLQVAPQEETVGGNIDTARKYIQLLKVAELENLLQCRLPIQQQVSIDEVTNRANSTEATVYPIILKDRIEIIYKLPQSTQLGHESTSISWVEVEKVISALQHDFAEPDTTRSVQTNSQKLYRWIISPIEEKLRKSTIKTETLVFLLDTPLLTVPMAALYNNGKYLIEEYAVAVTTGLQLQKPRALENLRVLLAGLSKPSLGFPGLPNIEDHFKKLESVIPPSQRERLMDFTASELEKKIKSSYFPVIYLATHGQFSSEPNETFVITAQEEKLDINAINSLLKGADRPGIGATELLALIACQTAEGDKWANLGLAGVAVQSGARSTLATLWKIPTDGFVGDLMSSFFKELQEGSNTTKAKALQFAQKEFINNEDKTRNRPYNWASYTLLENWL